MEQVVKVGKISVVTLIIRLIIDFFAIAFIVGFFWFVRDIVVFLNTRITITTKKITGHTGFIHTNELDSPLNKINGVQIEQGLFGKIFNYGTICVSTASTVFRFPYIEKPNEFKTVLNEQIEAYHDAKMEKHANKLAEAMKNQ